MNEIRLPAKDYHEMAKRLRAESAAWIQNYIKENSPVQVGDKVTTYYHGEVQVTEVKLHASSDWNTPGDKLSFSYLGIKTAKNGEMMKNRNPVEFGSCQKGTEYISNPSYLRVEIIPAKTYR